MFFNKKIGRSGCFTVWAQLSFLLLATQSFVSAQTALVNGASNPGTMTAGGVISYTFSGTAGQSVILRVGATNFVPKIELFQSNGLLVNSQPATAPSGSTRDTVLTNSLPATDNYVVKVSTYYANSAGPYSLRFVAVPGTFTVSPGDDGGTIQSGDRVSGQMELGDLDTYTFTGNTGDAIQIRMGATGFVPRIDLFGPDGTPIGTQPGAGPSGALRDSALLMQLPATGTFTVVASSFYSGGSGSYSLSFARIPAAFNVPSGDDGGGFLNGAYNTGSIDLGDLDMWSFSANPGDGIQVRMGSTGFAPRLDIYGPTGTLLYTSPATPPSGSLRDTVQLFNAPAAGTYTVVASSYYAGGNGDYSITLAHVPEQITVTPGDNGGALNSGFQNSGTIALGDLDVWSFFANAGNSIQLRMGGTGFVPRIDLYGPDGTLLSTSPDSPPSGAQRDSALLAQVAATGTYTVVASSYYSGGNGDYSLSFARIPDQNQIAPGDEGGPLTNGWLHVGTVDLGDLDVWTFSGKTGEGIELRMGATNLVPRLDLYGPDGALLATVPPAGSSGALRDVLLTNRLAADGIFTVVASSFYSGGAGGYSLTLAQANEAALAAPGDQGGTLTNGWVNFGTNSLGDIDVWSFYGTPGDSNVFRVGTSGFTPWVRIYGPSGELVKDGGGLGGTVRTNQVSYVVTNAGLYTLVFEAQYLGQSGTYNLKQSRVPPDINMPASIAIDEGQVLNVPITSQDPDDPNKTLAFKIVGAPPGVSLTSVGPTNAVINWATTEADGPSTNTFFVMVTDIVNLPAYTRTNTFTVIVNEVNVAPVLSVPQNMAIDELTPLSAGVSATDVDLPKNPLTYSLLAPPPGLSIDPNTGALSWTPTEAQGPGAYNVTVVVTDDSPSAVNAQHLSDTNTFTITVNEVNAPPQLAVGNQVIDEGKQLSIPLAPTDSDLPANTFTFSIVNGPQGLTVDPITGLISWTPTEAQGPSTNTVTVRVTDNSPAAVNDKNLSTTATFNIIVNEVNSAPVLPVIGAQALDELTPLLVKNTATDLDLPANTLSYVLLNPPAGASIASDGTITWTPTEAQGPTNVTLTTIVTDNGVPPLSATNSFSVTVNEVNTAPSIADIATQTVATRTLLSIPTSVTDSDLPANKVTLSLENAPTGMTIDPVSGVISWTPTDAQAGTNTITLKATDNGVPPLSQSKTFQVIAHQVVPAGGQLAISLLPGNSVQIEITGDIGKTYDLQISTDLKTWTSSRQIPLTTTTFDRREVIGTDNRFYRLQELQ